MKGQPSVARHPQVSREVTGHLPDLERGTDWGSARGVCGKGLKEK